MWILPSKPKWSISIIIPNSPAACSRVAYRECGQARTGVQRRPEGTNPTGFELAATDPMRHRAVSAGRIPQAGLLPQGRAQHVAHALLQSFVKANPDRQSDQALR